MLAGKVRHEQSGHYGRAFAVVSPGTAPAFCQPLPSVFARPWRWLATIRRRDVALTVGIGLASTPCDAVLLPGAFARPGPANGCVSAGCRRQSPEAGGVRPATGPISSNHALELLAAGSEFSGFRICRRCWSAWPADAAADGQGLGLALPAGGD